MRIPMTLVLVGLAASPAWSQFYAPALSNKDQSEANDRTNYPLMRAQSRSQYLLDASEVGPAAALTRLTLRYDGPAFGTGGGTIGSLDLYLGNNAVAAAQSGRVFAANYSGSLTKVASVQNLAFGADSSLNPSPWGGPGGEFVFNFASPFAYTGGNLVLEIRASGNTNSGAAAQECLLDAERDPLVGPAGGSATANGTGCHGASLQVTGQLAPGGQVSLVGAGLGAGSPLLALIGTSRAVWNGIPLPLPLSVVGAPGCWAYNDIQVGWPMQANATGALPAWSPLGTFPVPLSTALSGGGVQFQLLSVRPGINQFGASTSNNVEVRLGSFTPLYRGFYAHHNHLDHNAPTATYSAPTVLAMRFN